MIVCIVSPYKAIILKLFSHLQFEKRPKNLIRNVWLNMNHNLRWLNNFNIFISTFWKIRFFNTTSHFLLFNARKILMIRISSFYSLKTKIFYGKTFPWAQQVCILNLVALNKTVWTSIKSNQRSKQAFANIYKHLKHLRRKLNLSSNKKKQIFFGR